MESIPTVDFSALAKELAFSAAQVGSVVELLDEGNTVPFITRYRKEHTGNLDEEQIRSIQRRLHALRQLAERAETILRLIETQGKLTPRLRADILAADSLKRLDDLYLPFRPKRTSRASQARERGLEPLADAVWNQDGQLADLATGAAAYVDPAKELANVEAVLQGIADILAERVSEDADVRARCRRIATKTGRLEVGPTKAGEQSGSEYRDYFAYSETVRSTPPHRVLAINRGEKAGALKIKFSWDEPRANTELLIFLRLNDHRFGEFLQSCMADAITRLIGPGLEREIRREMLDKAESHAIEVFAENLRNLLLQPPAKGNRVLAIDPGFRTGCKTAVLDEYGNCLANDVVYVTGSAEKRGAAVDKLAQTLQEHECRLIAIGNGTACRETEELISELIACRIGDARYLIVNEAGASIYSTSSVARDEFPDLDATARGTISIGRRLQDPLSELVKIEPQHIGVGLYQHDLNSKRLKESLDEVVESCVNYVGVDLNTASASLLRYVSGFNQLIARRVVEWREQNGRFNNRAQLMDVTGIGDATFTQAAGFLKIADGEDALDATWIHPESYPATRRLLERLEIALESLTGNGNIGDVLKDRELDLKSLAADLQLGEPTLKDIVDALAKPGRDPRSDLPEPLFKQGILKLDDLHPDMELRGTVLNVVDFGAFVDVGLKDSGLVHISQLANRFIKSPHDIVSVGDVVTVWVLGIDEERKRVSLSMISPRKRKKKERKARQKAAAQATDAAGDTGTLPPAADTPASQPPDKTADAPVAEVPEAAPAAESGSTPSDQPAESAATGPESATADKTEDQQTEPDAQPDASSAGSSPADPQGSIPEPHVVESRTVTKTPEDGATS